MPGMETRAPERTETSSGRVAVAEAAADRRLDPRERFADLRSQVGRIVSVVLVECRADLGGDGEAGRDGQADAGHLGEIGALAAEQVAHLGAALVMAGAEAVHPLGHRGLRSAFDL